MDLFHAIGQRRSIRFFQSWRPVEPTKIQRMLEAARLASQLGNLGAVRAVVVDNRHPPEGVREAITGPGSAVHGAMAPILIAWYLDLRARDECADRLKELIDVGALNPTHGWSYRAAEEFAARALGQIGEMPELPSLVEAMDAGQAIAQATLVAVSDGLGSCLLGCDGLALKLALGLPERSAVLALQTVGYPAEAPDAGGQRPRQPFETLFGWNRADMPLARDPEVVKELETAGMIQQPAKAAWRDDEVRALSRLFGLPE